jgi:hypothetical protein
MRHHTTCCETPTWSTSLLLLVPGFASTASKIYGSTSSTRWERSLSRSSVLGWKFYVSFNRCIVEVDVFELSTVWKLFPVQYLCLGRVCTRRTFVKFGILNDLRTNTRLLIHSDKKILLCHTRVYEACKKREFAFSVLLLF